MVLSEENWLGKSSAQALSSNPYPHALHRIRAFAPLLDAAEVRLFLTIRSFDTLLPSAYAEALRCAPVPGGFGRVRKAVANHPPSWLSVIAQLRSAIPHASLTIWRYEDYREHGIALMNELCGCDIGAPPSLADPVHTRTPSAKAIAKAEALNPVLSRPNWRNKIQAIFDEVDAADDTRFAPFTNREKSPLRRQYEEDIARINALEGVRLLKFEGT
jgi:hypothetical protein